jgi:flagellar biosynthesis protein FlhA
MPSDQDGKPHKGPLLVLSERVLVSPQETQTISLDRFAAPLESELVANFDPQQAGCFWAMAPAGGTDDRHARRLVKSVKRLTGNGVGMATAVLLCPSPAAFTSNAGWNRSCPRATVLALAEIPAEIRIRRIGVVG